MDIGVMIFPTDLTPRRRGSRPRPRAAGFESVWFPEHTHIPTSRKTPWPGGEPLPEQYRRTLDPFVALAARPPPPPSSSWAPASASSPSTIRIVLAKEVASRRPRCPAGASCSASASAGTSTRWSTTASIRKRRRAHVREKVLAMKALWTEDEASFDGEFVHVLAELVVAEARAAAASARDHGRRRRVR